MKVTDAYARGERRFEGPLMDISRSAVQAGLPYMTAISLQVKRWISRDTDSSMDAADERFSVLIRYIKQSLISKAASEGREGVHDFTVTWFEEDNEAELTRFTAICALLNENTPAITILLSDELRVMTH